MYNLKIWQFPHGRTSGVDHRHVHKYEYPSPKLPPLLLLRGTGLFLRLLLQVPSTVTCGTGLFPSILQIPTTCMWYIRHYYFSLFSESARPLFYVGGRDFFLSFLSQSRPRLYGTGLFLSLLLRIPTLILVYQYGTGFFLVLFSPNLHDVLHGAGFFLSHPLTPSAVMWDGLL